MPLKIDAELTPDQISEMAATPPASWFSGFQFANATSPTHPSPFMDQCTDYKRSFVTEWMERVVPNATVLDLFSATGSFSFLSLELGARSVVGVEYEEARVERARMVAKFLDGRYDVPPRFVHGDVYDLTRHISEPVDVSLAMGGLYHVPDPPHILDQLRAVTKRYMIVQTNNVVPIPGNWGRFVIRKTDLTQQGFSSYVGGRGAWYLTRDCFRAMLLHAGFRIIKERVPPLRKLKTYPWYFALAEPV